MASTSSTSSCGRDEDVYLDALGAQRIPDPTTAGDFCRRFTEPDVLTLMDAINESRLRVWAQQPDEFFPEAILDADGTIVPSDAECKRGMDFTYDGQYGYHPLLISLANTAEPFFLFNRSSNRPSQERADVFLDKAVTLCRRAGFGTILMRGDTRFALTKHLDRWDAAGDLRFVFGYEAADSLKDRADELPALVSSADTTAAVPDQAPHQREARAGQTRDRPARRYKSIELIEERVAEFRYQPVACRQSYRMIVLRKRLGIDKGQLRLFEEYRYFFYITNDRQMTAQEVVFCANDRCEQENLIAQLKSGVRALTTPVDDLVSNWAYMVMGSLAWSLKAWIASAGPGLAPAPSQQRRRGGRCCGWSSRRTAGVHPDAVPAVRSGRRLIYRLLSWNPWQGVFLRLVERLHGCWQC